MKWLLISVLGPVLGPVHLPRAALSAPAPCLWCRAGVGRAPEDAAEKESRVSRHPPAARRLAPLEGGSSPLFVRTCGSWSTVLPRSAQTGANEVYQAERVPLEAPDADGYSPTRVGRIILMIAAAPENISPILFGFWIFLTTLQSPNQTTNKPHERSNPVGGRSPRVGVRGHACGHGLC